MQLLATSLMLGMDSSAGMTPMRGLGRQAARPSSSYGATQGFTVSIFSCRLRKLGKKFRVHLIWFSLVRTGDKKKVGVDERGRAIYSAGGPKRLARARHRNAVSNPSHSNFSCQSQACTANSRIPTPVQPRVLRSARHAPMLLCKRAKWSTKR